MLQPDFPLETLQTPPVECTLDDQLLYGLFIGHHYTLAMRGPQNDMNKVEAYLWESIRDSIYNFPKEDGQWESSYQVMRHGSINSTLLWMLVKQKSIRVGPPFQSVLIILIGGPF